MQCGRDKSRVILNIIRNPVISLFNIVLIGRKVILRKLSENMFSPKIVEQMVPFNEHIESFAKKSHVIGFYKLTEVTTSP
jgi:hypothetical protein